MKKIYSRLLAAILVCTGSITFAQSDLVLTGILDGPLPGGLPKALEIYVLNDVADLGEYGIANANNGDPSNGAPLFVFPTGAATAGTYLYAASEIPGFEEYFGFAPDFNAGNVMSVNGDDVVELYHNGVVVDVYGEIGVDGTGHPWEYLDGWAYRVNGTGPSATFSIAEWTYSGIDAIDNETTNESAANPWPLGTYSAEPNSAIDATIVEIQFTPDPNGISPLLGQTVNTSGIVTAAFNNGFWIQDGEGEWTGIYVNQASAVVAPGDEVSLTGVVQESFGLTQIGNVAEYDVVSSGNALPNPVVLSTADANAEAYESVLISVTNALCTNANLGFGEWMVNDGSGDYMVASTLHNAGQIQFATYDLTGINQYSFNNFKLLPRDENDVILAAESQLAVGFEAETHTFGEADGTVSVYVEISNPLDIPTSLDIVVAGGTALNGVHYNFTDPTSIFFPESSEEAIAFEIEILDDMDENEDRTIIFEIQNVTNNALVSIGTLTVTIADDDAVVVITDIAIVAETDADGVLINDGTVYTIAGIVYGPNMRLSGLQFTVRDHTGGIGVFAPAVVDGYVVTEGDSVIIRGEADQFNGLAQLSFLESIQLVSQGNPINDPVVVTQLSEATESQLIKIECVTIVNPGQWTNSGSGFNVVVSNGTDEFEMRIVNAVDLYGTTPPNYSFDLIGIGGQFDSSVPHLSGYQIIPRGAADLIECAPAGAPENDECEGAFSLNGLVGGPVGIPIPSDVFTNVNATSVDDPNPNSVTPNCWFGNPLTGQTVWFSFTGNGGTYFIETVNCIGVVDYIDDGDTQMAIFTGDCENLTQVACNEDGPQAGSGHYPAGIEFQTQDGVEYYVMIDGYEAAQGQFCMQFTARSTDGITNANAFAFDMYPNPASDRLFVEAAETIESALLINVVGQEVRTFMFGVSGRIELNLSGIESGMYVLQLRSRNGFSTAKLVVE